MWANVTDPVPDPRILEALRASAVLHSAVLTPKGPHLTPTVFSWAAGRLWIVAPKRSVKVRALRADPRVGVLLAAGARYVIGSGTAAVWDPLGGSPRPNVDELVRGPFGATRYLTENLRHALSVVADSPTPWLVVDRVAVSISLERLALSTDTELIESWGEWPRHDALTRSANRGERFHLPGPASEIARRLLHSDGDAQLGLTSRCGPLALPAHWSAERHEAGLPADLAVLTGCVAPGPACLTRATSGYGVADKQGVLVRGPSTYRRAGDSALFHVTPHTVTTWRGQRVRTVSRARPEVRADD